MGCSRLIASAVGLLRDSQRSVGQGLAAGDARVTRAGERRATAAAGRRRAGGALGAARQPGARSHRLVRDRRATRRSRFYQAVAACELRARSSRRSTSRPTDRTAPRSSTSRACSPRRLPEIGPGGAVLAAFLTPIASFIERVLSLPGECRGRGDRSPIPVARRRRRARRASACGPRCAGGATGTSSVADALEHGEAARAADDAAPRRQARRASSRCSSSTTARRSSARRSGSTSCAGGWRRRIPTPPSRSRSSRSRTTSIRRRRSGSCRA